MEEEPFMFSREINNRDDNQSRDNLQSQQNINTPPPVQGSSFNSLPSISAPPNESFNNQSQITNPNPNDYQTQPHSPNQRNVVSSEATIIRHNNQDGALSVLVQWGDNVVSYEPLPELLKASQNEQLRSKALDYIQQNNIDLTTIFPSRLGLTPVRSSFRNLRAASMMNSRQRRDDLDDNGPPNKKMRMLSPIERHVENFHAEEGWAIQHLREFFFNNYSSLIPPTGTALFVAFVMYSTTVDGTTHVTLAQPSKFWQGIVKTSHDTFKHHVWLLEDCGFLAPFTPTKQKKCWRIISPLPVLSVNYEAPTLSQVKQARKEAKKRAANQNQNAMQGNALSPQGMQPNLGPPSLTRHMVMTSQLTNSGLHQHNPQQMQGNDLNNQPIQQGPPMSSSMPSPMNSQPPSISSQAMQQNNISSPKMEFTDRIGDH